MSYDLLPIENDVYIYKKESPTGTVSFYAFVFSIYTLHRNISYVYTHYTLLLYNILHTILHHATTVIFQKEAEVILDESDDLWVELRHQHIANVSQLVAFVLHYI